MFKNYLLVAFRNLWRNKTYSFINIIGLSLGLACCMLIFLYEKDEVSYDRFHAKKDVIYRVVAAFNSPDGSSNKIASTGMMPGPAFKSRIPEIEDYVRVSSNEYTISHNGEIFSQEALVVDDNFFSIFSFPMIAGDPSKALKDIHSIVLSEEVAEKYFGKKNAVGQTLELKVGDKFEPFLVAGITKKSPQNSSIKIKMLVSMKFSQSQDDDKQWMNFFLNTFIVVKPGSNIAAIESKFAKVFAADAATQLKEATEKYGFKDKIWFGLQPLLQMHLSKEFIADNGLSDASNPMYSYILSGIALFILLIACINFINLTVARSLRRAKEIGIRKVIGGERRQLIAQFLGESFLLSFIAFVFAIGLVEAILPLFNTLANKSLSFSYLFDLKLVAGYIGLFLVTGLLAGFYPALVLSGFNPVQTLYGRIRFSRKNYLSKGLVVLQFTLATFLIIATITIYSQFNYLLHYDLGYNDKNVVGFRTDKMTKEQLDVFSTELRKNSSIKKVTADQGGRWGTIAHINDGKDINFDYRYIDENYFPLFEIPVVKGRNFSKQITSDTAEAVLVNESFVKQAGWKNPIGQIIDFFYNKKQFTVIGVVKDYNFASLSEKIKPHIFSANPSRYQRVFIKLTGNNTADALTYLRKTFKKFFPFQPYEYNFIDAQNTKQYESEAKWKQIISFGAILTILISCIGLFGLATLSAERRTKEIGIRKVLGASVSGIVKKLSNDFLKLVLVSALLSIPAAWWAMGKWLENYPYRIALGYWIFGFAAILVLLIAFLTVGFQALKAANANPVKSLRTE